jgi:hypothetical protein
MPFHFIEQAFSFGLNVEIGKNADRDEDRQYDTEGQFKADFAVNPHNSPATQRSSIFAKAPFRACFSDS